MNILVIGRFYDEGFALHIADSLQSMGHEIRRFDPVDDGAGNRREFGRRLARVRDVFRLASDNIAFLRNRRMQRLWNLVEQYPVGLVIVCHDFLWPNEIQELKRRTKATLVLWFPDSMATIGRGLFMNAGFDALFFKDPYLVRVLDGVVQAGVYYLPECFSEHRHQFPSGANEKDSTYACDVAIVGNLHSYRVAFFNQLSQYDVKLWGNFAPPWLPLGHVRSMHQNRAVFYEEKAKAFRGGKIVVNNLFYAEVWGVNVRTFEAAGAGAFQMVDWRPGLSQLFSIGSEIITFRGMNDLKAKIDYWLPRSDERRAIGMAAMRRAHAEHTYRHRLELLLATMDGRARGFSMPDIRYCED